MQLNAKPKIGFADLEAIQEAVADEMDKYSDMSKYFGVIVSEYWKSLSVHSVAAMGRCVYSYTITWPYCNECQSESTSCILKLL